MTVSSGERPLGHRSLRLAFALVALVTIGAVVAVVQQSVGPESLEPRPVLVELFTSEGCLSCPPADELLMKLAEEQPVRGALIIPLSQHVDYWNSAWRDPFSSSVFTDRQMSYNRALGTNAAYTPQMVVDGRFELVGSRGRLAQDVIATSARAPKATIRLRQGQSRLDNTVSIQLGLDAVDQFLVGKQLELWLAVTEQGLETRVERGENAFRLLRHPAVVRTVKAVETFVWTKAEAKSFEAVVDLEPRWVRSQLRVVAVLQDLSSRQIFGVSQIRVNELE